jgi:tetratricopeptide (TPR) repeat protein
LIFKKLNPAFSFLNFTGLCKFKRKIVVWQINPNPLFMKSRFLLLFLLCASLAFSQSQNAYNKAYQLYQDGKYELALKEVNLLIEQAPDSALYYDLRAEVRIKLKDMSKALDDFNRAIQLEPANPYFYSHRGLFFYRTLNPDHAIEDLNTALKYVTNDTLRYSIITDRGSARTQKRDFKGAYEDYSTALRFDSNNIVTLTNMGAILDELDRAAEAIPLLEKVIRIDPEFVGGYGNLAFRYAQMGDYKKALALNNKVLELDPNEALGYNNRGYVKYKLNDHQGALKDINKSLQLYPGNSYAYRNRALVYLALRQNTKACADLQAALSYGFTEVYGEEVKELVAKNCNK